MTERDYSQRIYSDRIGELRRELMRTARVFLSTSQATALYETCGRSIQVAARQFSEYSLMMFESERRTPKVEEIIEEIRKAKSPRQSS